MMQHSANGTALRLRFGTELSTGLTTSSNMGGASEAAKPLAELPEPAVTREEGAWSNRAVGAADTEERTAEDDMEHGPKASDELGPEPAGLESDFRFDLHDMQADTLLGIYSAKLTVAIFTLILAHYSHTVPYHWNG